MKGWETKRASRDDKNRCLKVYIYHVITRSFSHIRSATSIQSQLRMSKNQSIKISSLFLSNDRILSQCNYTYSSLQPTAGDSSLPLSIDGHKMRKYLIPAAMADQASCSQEFSLFNLFFSSWDLATRSNTSTTASSGDCLRSSRNDKDFSWAEKLQHWTLSLIAKQTKISILLYIFC